MFEKYNEISEKKRIKKNLILPSSFLDKWISTKEDGTKCFKYIDFQSDEIIEVDVYNEPLINVLFSWDTSFNIDRINKRYNQISKIAKSIIERRVDKEHGYISLTGKEVLFIKYFYFLVSLLNGDYKYFFVSRDKRYRLFDAVNKETPSEVRRTILSIISYVIFEMYDYIFTSRTFESLYDYVENSGINFSEQEYKKQIIIPNDFDLEQNYKFVDYYFHNIVNNTFLKMYKISMLEKSSFLLTNKTIAHFMDERTKLNVLSVFVVDPRFAFGLVNMGPGRGEYRPMFKYLTSQNKMDRENISACVKPEHIIEEEGIYLGETQKFSFKPFELVENQIRLINDCLTYRDLKLDFEQFLKY